MLTMIYFISYERCEEKPKLLTDVHINVPCGVVLRVLFAPYTHTVCILLEVLNILYINISEVYNIYGILLQTQC